MNNSPFSGLSLLVHVVVIIIATVIALIVGQRRVEAFKRSLSAGSAARHEFLLRNFSIAIVVLLALFITFATGVAIKTGLREGAKESHTEYMMNGFNTLMEAYVASSAFAMTHLNPDNLPLISQTSTYVRADGN